MKQIAFALVFFLQDGSVDESLTRLYAKKQNCLYMCQELSKSAINYTPVKCACEVRFVDAKTVLIR